MGTVYSVREVECPTCQAGIGLPCRHSGMPLTREHAERKDAYLDLLLFRNEFPDADREAAET